MKNKFQLISRTLVGACVLLSFVVGQRATAETPEHPLSPVKVATEEYFNATLPGEKGAYFDILRAVFDPEGIRITSTIVPYERAVKEVEDDKADFWIASYIDEVEWAIYPKTPHGADKVVAVSPKDSPASADWKGLESLKDRQLLWIRGYEYDSYIDFPVNFREIDSMEVALRLLDRQRADYFLDNGEDILDFMKENSIDPAGYVFHDVLTLKLYFGFKDSPRARQIIEIIDARLPGLIASGKIKEIFAAHDLAYPFE